MKKLLKENYWFVIVVIAIILIKNFIFTPVIVDGPSMEPTLKNGNIMIMSRLTYKSNLPKRFDIVVIQKKVPIIKRVIGLPGERVMIKDNLLYINNKLVSEPYKHKLTLDYKLEQVIPDGNYFVLGDNRPVSNDSRSFGLISQEEMLGNIIISIIPPKII